MAIRSEAELQLAAKKARDFDCQTIIHTGDLTDRHFGHHAFDGFEIYVFLTNQRENIPQVLPVN